MSSFEEARRFVEFRLFTRPTEFGGDSCRDTSITHILDQGIIEPRTVREMEVRARTVPRSFPGLEFSAIKLIGPRQRVVQLTYLFDGRPITLEAGLV